MLFLLFIFFKKFSISLLIFKASSCSFTAHLTLWKPQCAFDSPSHWKTLCLVRNLISSQHCSITCDLSRNVFTTFSISHRTLMFGITSCLLLHVRRYVGGINVIKRYWSEINFPRRSELSHVRVSTEISSAVKMSQSLSNLSTQTNAVRLTMK